MALAEIARVLKPGGIVVISDIRHFREYVAELKGRGLVAVERVSSAAVLWIWRVFSFGMASPATLRARKPVAVLA